MTTNISLLTDCEGPCLDVAVGGQSVRPHTKSVQRWPVVLLSQLSVDTACYGPCDDAAITGRRPSDVYGEAARARWKSGRRPMARSAATIRAARAARLVIASTDDTASSLNCSSATVKSDNPAARDTQEKAQSTVDGVTHLISSNGGVEDSVTSGAEDLPSESLILSTKKFYNSCVAMKPNLVASPSTEEPADSAVVDRHVSDNDHLLVSSSSKYNSRKRKLSRQLAAKCIKKTDDTSTDVDDDSECDDTLPIVSIDEKYASMSVTAMTVMDCTAYVQPKPTSGESLTTISEPLVSLASTHVALSTSDSIATSTRNLTSRKRAEHTIFERFSNTLSLHKPPTSVTNDVIPTATLTKTEGDAVPSAVPDVKIETIVLQQNGPETHIKQPDTIDQKRPETPMKVNDETVDSNLIVTTDTVHYNSTLDGAQTTTAEAEADKLIKTDDDDRKRDDADAEQNNINRRPNEERKTRSIKPTRRYGEDLDLLVRSRPVRKRQPTVYMDAAFYKSIRSGRKVVLPAKTKTHGSCLLPSDFDSSLSGSSGVARKSWKTVFDGPEMLSVKTSPGPRKKTKRQYRRRKGTVAEDEVKWTIHKKLLLGGSTCKTPKSAPRSKFPAKRKLKSPPNSSTVGSKAGKLRTRSMTRIQGNAAEQKSAAYKASHTHSADASSVISVGAFTTKGEVREAGPPTNCVVNSTLPSTDNVSLSSNLSSSPATAAVTKPDSPSDDKVKETTSSDTPRSTSWTTTTTMTVEQCFEPPDKDDAVETASLTSPQENVQCKEAEPEVLSAAVTCSDEASVVTDQTASKIVDGGSTLTTATNTDETKVDDESVEALMHLVKQLHDAVANEQRRKAKGDDSTLFTNINVANNATQCISVRRCIMKRADMYTNLGLYFYVTF